MAVADVRDALWGLDGFDGGRVRGDDEVVGLAAVPSTELAGEIPDGQWVEREEPAAGGPGAQERGFAAEGVDGGAYGGAVGQRARGPALAASLGAAGVLVRSVTTKFDTVPHSGSTRFDSLRVPCAAISFVDADLLTQKLSLDKNLKVRMNIQAEDLEEITSCNLIADLRGNVYPDEYIVVGGHIDAWYNTPGAHDDGAGCAQSADVMRIFKELAISNKRTIRVVLFMDEELFQSGSRAFAQYCADNNISNFLAMETDAGGFTPVGFMVDADDPIVENFAAYQELLEPYGIYYIQKGGSGVDIDPLKKQGVPLIGYRTDSQRYMDIHHSASDTMDKINIRELQLGSGCMAALIYLIDNYGY